MDESIAETILSLMALAPSALIAHFPRVHNSVAHELAQFCLSNAYDVLFRDAIPLCSKNAVISNCPLLKYISLLLKKIHNSFKISNI